MEACIKDIVKNIGKNIEFLQPVYEAIVNSLEANATNILVEFFRDDQEVIDGCSGKINSFEITDDGDGFTEDNRTSFGRLWTPYKIDKGCKGCGRFTWLNVFSNINILSEIAISKEIVEIPFTEEYDNNDIEVYNNQDVKKNKTTIAFKDVTNNMFKKSSENKPVVDLREPADIECIYEKIFNCLFVKLFLLKKSRQQFKIEIKYNNKVLSISNSDVPDLLYKEFEVPTEIKTDRYGDSIKFEIYYVFKKDNKRSKKAFYCANERTVEKIDDDSLGFSASLPGGDSFIVLLCSKYFNDNVSQDRNTLDGLTGLKTRNFSCPILLSDIKKALKIEINRIILEEYPDMVTINKDIKDGAIQKNPHLASYIKSNDDTLISEDSLTKAAKKEFNDAKETIKQKFEKLLTDFDINIDALSLSITEVSEMAAAELGEYILYREKIIKALQAAIGDKNKKEAFIHNIFIPKGKCINGTQGVPNYTMTNL